MPWTLDPPVGAKTYKAPAGTVKNPKGDEPKKWTLDPAVGESQTPETSLWDKAKSAGRAAVDYVTGKGRTEGYPELPNQGYKTDKTDTGLTGLSAQRMSLAQSDAGKLDIFLKMRQEAGKPLSEGQYGFDQYGNAWVAPEGKKMYLNAPGLSGQDAADAATTYGIQMPFYRLGGGMGAGTGFVGKTVGTAAGGAAGSVAQDVAASGVGSEQGVDPAKAAMAGALGGAFEALSPAVSVAYRSLVNLGKKYFNGGKLTTAGEEWLASAGVDPKQISSEFAEAFANQVRAGVNPKQAAAAADAASLPVPVKLTRGQQTLSAGDQLFEDNAAKGAYGGTAERLIVGAKAEQESALRGNVTAIQDRIAGGRGTIARPQDAGEAAQARLSDAERQMKAGVDQAYTAAKQTDGAIAGGDFDRAVMNVGNAMAQEATPATAPKAFAILNDMKANAGKPRSEMLRDVFQKRRQLSNLRAGNDADAVAAGTAVKSIDEELSALLEKDLIAGDPATVGLWKDAIGKARERFARFYEKGDIVDKLVERTKGPGARLVVPPDNAVNVIFGSKALFGGRVAARDMKRLRDELGKDSPEWGQIREAAWLRLSENAFGGMTATNERNMSATKFANALDKTMRENFDTMKTLFTAEELALMEQFKRVMARTKIPTEGGKNFSNTTAALANIMQKLIGVLFLSEGASARWVAIPGIRAMYNAAMVPRAIATAAGNVPKAGVVPGVTGFLGSVPATRNASQ